MSAAAYVDALFAAAGVVPTAAERNAAIAAFAAGGTAGRVAALRNAADSHSVRQAEVNADFVLMQYYGYLRRNPTDAPDSNDDGYQFWFAKLNSFGGNFIQAEMVKGLPRLRRVSSPLRTELTPTFRRGSLLRPTANLNQDSCFKPVFPKSKRGAPMSRRSGLAILLTCALLTPLLFVPQSHAETGRVPKSAWPKTATTAALVQQPSGEISPNVLKALGIATRPDADPAAMQQEVARQITGDQNATVSAPPPSTDEWLNAD